MKITKKMNFAEVQSSGWPWDPSVGCQFVMCDKLHSETSSPGTVDTVAGSTLQGTSCKPKRKVNKLCTVSTLC